MYLYVELWNVTDKWMNLSKEKRRAYMDKFSQSVQETSEGRIDNLGWAMNDEHTPYRSDYRYMTLWKIPSLEAVKEFEQNMKDAHWHDYFSQVNSRGKLLPFTEALDFLVNLEKNSTSLLD